MPTVGGDFNIWGNELNTDLLILDGLGASPASTPSASGPIVLGNLIETFVMATGGLGITLTTPAPNTFTGKIITVKKVDSGFGAVTIVPTAGSIDGNASYLLVNQYQFVRLYSDGTNLQIVGAN